MSVPLNQFIQELPERIAAATANPNNCCTQPDCKNHAGNNELGGKPVCDDCYFEYLGNLVERHPIGIGRPHGGCVAGDD